MQPGIFLTDLINISSTTGQEADLVNALSASLRKLVFQVQLQPLNHGRANILAFVDPHPQILFCTHLDTVPPHIPARREDDVIFGRGACDAKGALASMVCAVMALRDLGEKRAGLLIVVGEETDSIGARTAPGLIPSAHFIIVGEPTGNRLVAAQKGTMIFRLSAQGKAVHSGYPEHGESATHLLISQLHALSEQRWGTDPTLGQATLNVGRIQGGSAVNVVADRAEAECCLRLVGDCDEAEEILRCALLPGVSCEVSVRSEPQSLFVPPGHDGIVVKFGSDVPYLRRIATPLMAGPGSILDSHTAGECIQVDQLHEAVELYRSLALELLDLRGSNAG